MLILSFTNCTEGRLKKYIMRSSGRIEVAETSRKKRKVHLQEGKKKKQKRPAVVSHCRDAQSCQISIYDSQKPRCKSAKTKGYYGFRWNQLVLYEYSYTAVPGTNCCNVRISILVYQVLLTAVTYLGLCAVYQVQLLCSSTCCSPLYIWRVYLVPVHILAPYPWYHAVPKTI